MINITDSADTLNGVNVAVVGFAVPIILSLDITAIVCGALGIPVQLMRRKIMSNA